MILGFPLAVCHRCTGIYFGFLAGSLVKNPFPKLSPGMRRIWVVAAVMPLLLDVSLTVIGIGTGSAAGRVLTGFLFGAMLSSLLLQGIREFLDDISMQRLYFKGGLE